ncbi:MAG: hypothetical protein JSS81_06200 [Acidobacteria bacterium]|nr:hypothetical protein [Acidobacteriota bacterium]
MKPLRSKIIAFGLALLLFALAAVQVLTGAAFGGRTGHQTRIYLAEQPVKFWTIVGLTTLAGLCAFGWGLRLVLRREKK